MDPVILGTCIWLFNSAGAVAISPQFPDPRDCGTEPGGPVWAKVEQPSLKDIIVGRVRDRIVARVHGVDGAPFRARVLGAVSTRLHANHPRLTTVARLARH